MKMVNRNPGLSNLPAYAFVSLLIPPNPALAGGLPKNPMLRIETGMQTATPNRIGVDERERILVTASDDKSVRVWDLETGRLRKILRVPIDKGMDRKLYSVQFSPTEPPWPRRGDHDQDAGSISFRACQGVKPGPADAHHGQAEDGARFSDFYAVSHNAG
jgi:hypothetical protein